MSQDVSDELVVRLRHGAQYQHRQLLSVVVDDMLVWSNIRERPTISKWTEITVTGGE